MTASNPLPRTAPRRGRHRTLPHLGMPKTRESRLVGVLSSAGAHLLVLLLLVGPVAARQVIVEQPQGAGGPGPAGGGGGGRQGTGGDSGAERLRFVQVAPPPPAVVTPAPQPTPVPPPVVTPPVPEAKPQPTPAVTPTPAEQKPASDPAPTPGAGGGTGSDGTNGSGPGSGGGVGSGVGTGRGSGVGSGTGGGTQANYPPTPLEVFIPPQPTPDRVKGTRVVAEFDVDESGRVLGMRFTETRDGGYNRKLRDVLRSMTRFRPGTRPDGTPIRMTAQIIFDL